MNDTFFARDQVVALRELTDELYKRLHDTRSLLEMYDMDTNLSYVNRGYAQGIREEKAYLERLLDKYERS